MTNSISSPDPAYYKHGIELGPTEPSDVNRMRPILIGTQDEALLQVKNCHVKLDDERQLTTSSLVTNYLTISNTRINSISTQVNNSSDPNSLLTLGGITQYFKSLSPWVIKEDNSIYYGNGKVGIGNVDSLMLLSSKEGTGMIAVGKSLISIDNSNLILTTEGEQIVSLGAKTTVIDSTLLKLNGKLQLRESPAVNNITNTINLDDDAGNSSTLPTAKAVTDFVKKYVKDNVPGGQAAWQANPGTDTKGISYIADGRVGIGTNVPKAKLHVSSGAIMASSVTIPKEKNTGIVFESKPGDGSGDRAWIRYYANDVKRRILEIGTSNGDAVIPGRVDNIAIMPSGLLGIGTNNPSKAKVEIFGTIKTELSNFNYIHGLEGQKQIGRINFTVHYPYSLYADGCIASSEYNAFSDTRIKDIIGLSDSISDLNTLLKIQVTDYSYKDKIQQGHGQHKKVIGQQIARIFPQAVKTHTDVIPDIYRPATIRGGWVQLPDHGLSVGERVRLFCDDSEPVIYTIKEASKDSFRVPLQFEGEIFVYGREVDDFHVVDYEAISMLHVSATQELYKIIQGLKQDVENLKTQLATMNGRGFSPIAHA